MDPYAVTYRYTTKDGIACETTLHVQAQSLKHAKNVARGIFITTDPIDCTINSTGVRFTTEGSKRKRGRKSR